MPLCKFPPSRGVAVQRLAENRRSSGQDSDGCLKLKHSGRELHGDLWTRAAMRNSACSYLTLGASTREIAPYAVLAIHSPKVVLRFSGGAPTPRRGLRRPNEVSRGSIAGEPARNLSAAKRRRPRANERVAGPRGEIARLVPPVPVQASTNLDVTDISEPFRSGTRRQALCRVLGPPREFSIRSSRPARYKIASTGKTEGKVT
jgi:hypothetical protein